MTHHNVLLFFVLSLFALCTNAQDPQLQTRFEDQYEKLVSQIKQREDSAAELQQVKAIWLSTHKQLIAINAEIDAKKLDVAVSSGRQQERVVDELIAMGGARERTLLEGINKLYTIAKGGTVATSPDPLMEGAGERVGISDQKLSSKKSGSVSISIEPEDIGTSGLP